MCLQVTVRDNGRPPLSSTTRIVIEVADINDHGPEFEQKFYTVQIPASPATDKPLFQVQISSSFSARVLRGSSRDDGLSIHSVFLVNTFFHADEWTGAQNKSGRRTATQISPERSCFLRCRSPRVKSANLYVPLYVCTYRALPVKLF